MKTKALCICLVFLMLFPLAFYGCAGQSAETEVNTGSDTQPDTQNTAEETTTEPEVSDDLPETNYKGRTIRVLVVDRGQSDFYTEDHETGETIHDAVFTRNNNVSERFGVKFEGIVETEDGASAKLSNSVKAGSDEYDICFLHMVNGATNAMNNDVLPFDELPYVDLSKPWWDKSVSDGFSIKGHLMMINGDISPFSFGTTACLLFNKNLFEKNDFESPYQLVREGKWTLDKVNELTKDFSQDNDGDGKITADGSDQFGLTAWFLGLPYAFYYGSGGMLIQKDDDDVPYFEAQVERDTNIYNKIYDIVITNNANYETQLWNLPGDIFNSGRALMFTGCLNDTTRFRDMNDDFGILPIPKYDESQKEYRSYVDGSSAMICVPATVKPADRECISIILEALASESYKIVTPAFVEKMLKRKVTRDSDSADMIDYVVRNRVFDMGYVFMYNAIGSYVRELLISGKKDVASSLKKHEKSTIQKCKQIVKAFEKSYTK